ncbi:MAG: nitrous oxide reductase family maturation protein NosD [Candidatus Hermodarchaeota archaeon]
MISIKKNSIFLLLALLIVLILGGWNPHARLPLVNDVNRDLVPQSTEKDHLKAESLLGLRIVDYSQKHTERQYSPPPSTGAVLNINPPRAHSSYLDHDPIYISGNSGFSEFPGNGEDQPYLIDGYRIVGDKTIPIEIWNTNVNFQISNCWLEGGSTGIRLTNVTHGYITTNVVYYNWNFGISLIVSNNNTLFNNTVYHDDKEITSNGIDIDSSSNNTISRNTVYNRDNGIHLQNSSHNTVFKNIINNTNNGMLFELSTHNTVSVNIVTTNNIGISISSSCWNNTLSQNNVCYNDYGIEIHGSNNTLSANTIYRQIYEGIEIKSGSNNTLSANTISENRRGIEIAGPSSNTTLSTNAIYYNRWDGIYTLGNYTMIIDNKIYDNKMWGIIIKLSSHNTVANNEIIDNTDGGIGLEAFNNTIHSNFIQSNTKGISLDRAYNNTIIVNFINWSTTGIYIRDSSNNIISCNNIWNSTEYGIQIAKGNSVSQDNIVCWNNFRGNNPTGTSQGYDDGRYTVFSRNYWDDWTGSGAYAIDGTANNQDESPFVSPIDNSLNNCPILPLPYPTITPFAGFITILVALSMIVVLLHQRKRV